MTKAIRKIIVAIFIFSPAGAWPITCSLAKSEVEKLICSSTALLELDKALSAAFEEKARTAAEKEEAIKVQKNWLAGIRNKCESEACLTEAYRSRIEAISLPLKQRTKGIIGNDYLCWQNVKSTKAPRIIEISFEKDKSGNYSGAARVKKYDNVPAEKLSVIKYSSAVETSKDRPFEFTSKWRERGAARYIITTQNFPRHVEYFPSGLNKYSVSYEPIGIPSDESCFASALEADRRPK